MYLYVISDGEYCKVGISSNPKSRLKTLQVGNPQTLYIDRTYHLCADPTFIEVSVHDYLWMDHIRGEWFLCDPDDVDDALYYMDWDETMPLPYACVHVCDGRGGVFT